MKYKKNISKNYIFVYSFTLVGLFCMMYYLYYLNIQLQEKFNVISTQEYNQIFQYLTFSLLLLFICILAISQYFHSNITKSNALKIKSRDELEIINTLYNHLQQFHNVKEISNQALHFLGKQLHAKQGKIYIVDYLNEQLHLSGEFNIKVKNEERILEIYRGTMGEAVAFQKIKHLKTSYNHKLFIPLVYDKKTIATIVLYLDVNDTNTINLELSPFHHTLIKIITNFLRNELKNEQNKRYFNLIDNYVITSSTNKEGKITYASKGFENILGYNKDELLGKSHSLMRSSNIKDIVFTKMWESISKGNIWSSEIENFKKDSSSCWLNTTIQPDFDYYDNIIGYTAIRTDITNKKAIEKISITDAMTNIYNRRFFDTTFPKQLHLSKRLDKRLAFCMIDIDNFKKYNDTYGHQEGDKALIEVAKVLKKSLKRENDFIFRLGGEEFGMLYFTQNANDALNIANQTRRSIENLQINHKKNCASEYITVSIGLYLYDSKKEDLTPEQIYLKTDTLLYKSKQNGRNQVTS